MDDFDNICTKLGNSSAEDMYPTYRAIDDIKNYSAAGLIEDVGKLKGKLLYFYAGLSNVILSVESMLSTVKILEPFIKILTKSGLAFKTPSSLRKLKICCEFCQKMSFLQPTDNPAGSECSEPSGDETKFYIGNCHLNVVYEILKFILSDSIQRPRGK